MCDTTTELFKEYKHDFKISTIYQSYNFLEAIANSFFDDPLANCSEETLVDWPEYRRIQYKAFLDYIRKIFTEEFLELRSATTYYAIFADKIEDNYNSYLKFFKSRGIL